MRPQSQSKPAASKASPSAMPHVLDGSSPATASAPALPPAAAHVPNEEFFGSRIQRTMTLLAKSTPTRSYPVRILFYGQSIVTTGWTPMVEAELRSRYPLADLTVENRAIGGFGMEMLARPAVHDVYPFYPDLIVHLVYGGTKDGRLERFIQDIRRNTTAEIMLITHQMLPVQEKGDDDSSDHFAYLCQKYNCELVDLRAEWKQYMKDHSVQTQQLLRDRTHPNGEGNKLIAAAVLRHFRCSLLFPSSWYDTVRTCDAKRSLDEGEQANEAILSGKWKASGSAAWSDSPDSSLKLTFEGNRVDIVTGWLNGKDFSPATMSAAPTAATKNAKASAPKPQLPKIGTARVLIDGQPPSANPMLYAITRPSPTPGIWFPGVRRVGHDKPLLIEDWTLHVKGLSDDAAEFTYEVVGSRTGPDGQGDGRDIFVSKSGRVVIDPRDFSFRQTRGVLKKPLPESFEVTWKVVPMFEDVYSPIQLEDSGPVHRVTVAQGLTNARHTIEVIPNGDGAVPIESIEVYRPPLR